MKMYDGIVKGLEEAIAFNEGKLNARTKKISVKPVPDFHAAEIKSIRAKLGMTQVLFANFMGVSTKTVEAWESGRNMPDGSARRMLSLLEIDPLIPQRFDIVTE